MRNKANKQIELHENSKLLDPNGHSQEREQIIPRMGGGYQKY